MIIESRMSGYWSLVCSLVLVGLLQMGCSTGGSKADSVGTYADNAQYASAAPVAGAAAPGTPLPGAPSLDALHVGDMLTVDLTDMPMPQMQREERIKEDGTITLLEGKTFTAAGKSRGQLEKEIHDWYVPRYYLKMTVSVQQRHESQFYYVRGEVKLPGRQVYISRITVLKAIGSAGDFTDFASKSKVQLTRADGRNITINAKKALKDPSLDLEVFPGDAVYVPRRKL